MMDSFECGNKLQSSIKIKCSLFYFLVGLRTYQHPCTRILGTVTALYASEPVDIRARVKRDGDL